MFDGANAERPYREDDLTRPLCWYAETKLVGEQLALQAGENVTIARIEMPFSGRNHRKRDIARAFVARLQAGSSVNAVLDQKITPVFLDDAVDALRHVLEQSASGILHVASADATTPYEFARAVARRLSFNADLVAATTFDEFATTRPARRPRHSWLDVTRFSSTVRSGVLRTVDAQLDAWADQLLAAV